jgi:hypothetical protein
MERGFELGLEVNIVEFEVPLLLPATDDELLAQADIYGDMLHLCLCSKTCKVFEMWGFTDRYSWIPLYFPGWGAALITDENYIPKPAFYALADELNAVYDNDIDGIPDDNGTCTRIQNPCSGGETVDCYDNCALTPNSDQLDADNDGIGDVCDTCTDTDEDGYGNPGYPANTCAEDNCPVTANPDQLDADSDSVGDVCDTCTDTDDDGYGNPGYPANTCAEDNCPVNSNPDQLDADSDSVGAVCDTCTDTDDDGYGNPGYPANTCEEDNCPVTLNPDQSDVDNDGVGDECDNCVSTMPARIGGVEYKTIWEAYSSAVENDTILCQDRIYVGDFAADRDISVTIQGGYNCDYSSVTGVTSIEGDVMIGGPAVSEGKITTFENISVE